MVQNGKSVRQKMNKKFIEDLNALIVTYLCHYSEDENPNYANGVEKGVRLVATDLIKLLEKHKILHLNLNEGDK